MEQDELHRKSIAAQIEGHIDTLTAVLVLANGTVPRVTVGTNYALSILSAKTSASNIGFLLTNTSNPLYQNFSADALPGALKASPQFLLNNPIALQRKYLELKDNLEMKSRRMDFREAVQAAEQKAGEMLVDLFGWLDSLESQPITKVIPLTEGCQKTMGTNTRRIKELLRKIKV